MDGIQYKSPPPPPSSAEAVLRHTRHCTCCKPLFVHLLVMRVEGVGGGFVEVFRGVANPPAKSGLGIPKDSSHFGPSTPPLLQDEEGYQACCLPERYIPMVTNASGSDKLTIPATFMGVGAGQQLRNVMKDAGGSAHVRMATNGPAFGWLVWLGLWSASAPAPPTLSHVLRQADKAPCHEAAHAFPSLLVPLITQRPQGGHHPTILSPCAFPLCLFCWTSTTTRPLLNALVGQRPKKKYPKWAFNFGPL